MLEPYTQKSISCALVLYEVSLKKFRIPFLRNVSYEDIYFRLIDWELIQKKTFIIISKKIFSIITYSSNNFIIIIH